MAEKHNIAPYYGQLKNGRMTGKGTHYFDNNTKYVGEFKDGLFHGSGILYFENGGRYEGSWENGKEVSGTYFFKDGMSYNEKPFKYSTESDRRFYQEHVNGLRPATLSLLSASCNVNTGKPLQNIPNECYDTGEGIYDQTKRCIYHYSNNYAQSKFGKFLKYVTDDEHAWIVAYCRKGMDEFIGFNHPRFCYKDTKTRSVAFKDE